MIKNINIENRIGKHNFIHYFEPKGKFVCRRFPVFSWANGCPFSCRYCYLNLTLRIQRRSAKIIVWTNYQEMARQVKKWAAVSSKEEYLNAGELSDALAIADDNCSYSQKMLEAVIPCLMPNRGLYLLTKSAGATLLNFEPNPDVIAAFSVNSETAAKLYEINVPSPTERLAGAKRLRDLGWRIRIRLDPMIPHEGWQRDYERIIDKINLLEPERVTIGSLRFHPLLPKFCPESDIWKYGSERDAGGKLRISTEKTLELYRFALGRLCCKYIVPCKESVQIWKALKLKGLKCACQA
ncbi:MAG: hypothetical protein QME47_06000 [Candidatus Thermoplasmatota archaeon]|nr:hypothetical protein [Candidatus Thermoplasmatota archaeon]